MAYRLIATQREQNDDYPFTPLLVALSMKKRCAKTKMIIGGITEMAAPANTKLGLSAARPRKTLSERVSTWLSTLPVLIITNGQKKLFHA